MATDDEIQALRVIHEHLEPGERVLLFGRGRLKGSPAKLLMLLCSIMLVLMMLLCATFLFPVFKFQVTAWAALCVPIALILSLKGRDFGFCALTDRRLLQLGEEGGLEFASRNEVRQVAGTDSKIMLMVAKVKKDATNEELRLGRKVFQQIELSPVRNLIELVGGKELLIDQLGSNQ